MIRTLDLAVFQIRIHTGIDPHATSMDLDQDPCRYSDPDPEGVVYANKGEDKPERQIING
jgi:hypothetical protein